MPAVVPKTGYSLVEKHARYTQLIYRPNESALMSGELPNTPPLPVNLKSPRESGSTDALSPAPAVRSCTASAAARLSAPLRHDGTAAARFPSACISMMPPLPRSTRGIHRPDGIAPSSAHRPIRSCYSISRLQACTLSAERGRRTRFRAAHPTRGRDAGTRPTRRRAAAGPGCPAAARASRLPLPAPASPTLAAAAESRRPNSDAETHMRSGAPLV